MYTYKGEGFHVGNLMTDEDLGDRLSIYTKQRGMVSGLWSSSCLFLSYSLFPPWQQKKQETQSEVCIYLLHPIKRR